MIPDDPLAKVQHGDPAGQCLRESVAAGRAAGHALELCRSRDPMGVGLQCTRYSGHPGQHIADAEQCVAATWPPAVTA